MLKPSLEVWAVSPSHLHLPLGLYFQWLQSDSAGIGESTKEDTNPGNAKGGMWHHIFRKTQMAIARTIDCITLA